MTKTLKLGKSSGALHIYMVSPAWCTASLKRCEVLAYHLDQVFGGGGPPDEKDDSDEDTEEDTDEESVLFHPPL